jgi:hypothetical protein
MTRVAVQKTSFTAGEIKPELYGREDLAADNYGAMAIENRVPMPEGGLVRRSGTKMVCALVDETNKGKLMPFKFSRTDARVLILSGGVAKVGYAGGGLIQSGGGDYSFALPARWVPSMFGKIRWTESASVLYAVDGLGMPQVISRVADANWTVADYAPINGPVVPQNLDPSKTILASGTIGAITLTANFAAFQAGHVGSIWRLDEGDLGSIPYWTADEMIAITASAGNPATYRRNAGAVYAAFAGPGVAAGTVSVGVNPPTQTYGASLSAAGNASFQFKYMNFGYVRITAVTDDHHAQATVLGVGNTAQTVLPDSVTTTATYRWSEAAWSGVRGYPSLTAFAQQRLGFFVGYQFWLSYSGAYNNFIVDTSDASAISGALLAIDGSVLQPQWTYSSGWVVVGCADSEPVIRGPNVFDGLTQTNVLAVVDKGQGSTWHIPASVDAGVVNIGVNAKRLHYTKINRLFDTIDVVEISVNSNHIMNGLAAGVAYQHDPNRVVWGYSQNGDFWSYTFRPDQQVMAAARHPMPGGYVEDLCSIPTADGTGIELWMIVRRVINGATRRFVEVMQQFFVAQNAAAPNAKGAWFVDCGLEYSGAPTKSIGGLTHLAYTTARVFGDGAWLGDLPVAADGTIALPRAAADVVAGLPIVARVRTLALDPTRPGSTTKGDVKQATHAAADYFQAFGGMAYAYAQDEQGAWQTPDGGEGLFPSGSLVSGAAAPLFSGRKSFPLAGAHGRVVSLEVVDDHPYPSTLLSLSPDIEDGEI